MHRIECHHNGTRESGQSLPEFLIVVPVFLFLLLLIFQLVLIYRAKTTLDYATLEAARMGAMRNADPEEMRKGLARGLTPLYANEAGAAGVAVGPRPPPRRRSGSTSRI